MKNLKPFSTPLILLIVLIFFSCSLNESMESNSVEFEEKNNSSAERKNQVNIVKILPLGDSRVEGNTSNSVSYRYHLWKNLVLGGWTTDFIGPLTDSGNYPQIMGKSFDNNHAGVGGFRTVDILNNIDLIINSNYNPDIVLLGIGGNDLIHNVPTATAISNINGIIDALQASNPKITILVEQIAPGRSTTYNAGHFAILAQFNYQIKTLAHLQTTDNSKVIYVNMYDNWQDDYLADNTHYNELGAKVVAERYYTAFKNHLGR